MGCRRYWRGHGLWSPESVEVLAPVQDLDPIQPTAPQVLAPVQPTVHQDDDRVDIPAETTHHVDLGDGLHTPKNDPIHCTMVSNLYALILCFFNIKATHLDMINHWIFSLQSLSSFVPDCENGLKPVIGMSFDSLDEVEGFYKTYAHTCGFSVRIGSQGKKDDVVEHKRFVCSREGFTKRRVESSKQKKHFETRCGCNARIYVRLGQDKTYFIASFIEEHNHGLVSPDKIPFLRSNRTISERAKTTLFTCHKASIGTSQAYRLLQVSDCQTRGHRAGHVTKFKGLSPSYLLFILFISCLSRLNRR
jgi:hypothetical protein